MQVSNLPYSSIILAATSPSSKDLRCWAGSLLPTTTPRSLLACIMWGGRDRTGEGRQRGNSRLWICQDSATQWMIDPSCRPALPCVIHVTLSHCHTVTQLSCGSPVSHLPNETRYESYQKYLITSIIFITQYLPPATFCSEKCLLRNELNKLILTFHRILKFYHSHLTSTRIINRICSSSP